MDTKACSRCRLSKPVEMFHRRAGVKSGRRSECKVCTALYYRRHRPRNTAQHRLWRENHRVEYATYQKAYHARWLRDNRVKANAYQRQRRAILRGVHAQAATTTSP